MDDDLLYETLDGDDPFAEDKAKKEAIAHLESKEIKPSLISAEDIINVVDDHISVLLDWEDKERTRRKLIHICNLLYDYAYGIENKPSKPERERFHNHEESLSKKARDFKELLWDAKSCPENGKLQTLHNILGEMIDNPYKYAEPPNDIPATVFSKKYIEGHIVMTLSYRFDKRRGVRAAREALRHIDRLIEEAYQKSG